VARRPGTAATPRAILVTMPQTVPDGELAELRARVRELERLLERRSIELRALLRGFCTADLQRALDGYLPISPSLNGLAQWHETHTMRPAQIQPALESLWRSALHDGAEESDA